MVFPVEVAEEAGVAEAEVEILESCTASELRTASE